MEPADLVFWRLLLLGAATGTFQTLFAREYLAAFAGNESALASLLGPWLALTALGVAIGRRTGSLARGEPAPPRDGSAWFFAVGPLSALALAGARLLPRLFTGGAAPGGLWALSSAALLLAPACLSAGAAFGAATSRASPGPRAAETLGRGYVGEAIGSAAAGAALSLLLLGRVPPFALAGGAVALSTAAAVLGSSRALALPGVALAAALLPAGPFLLRHQASFLAGATEEPSAYGSVVIAKHDGQTTVFADRLPAGSSGERFAAEEAALPLAFAGDPGRVALIGTAPIGTVRQALRQGARRVDVLVEDPALAAALRSAFPDEYADPRVRLLAGDARRFLVAAGHAFDAILLRTPEPSTAQQNRFYTAEFFAAARDALRPGGLFALALPGFSEYAALPRRRLYSSVRATLGTAFRSVRLLPAGETLFLAAPEEGRLARPDPAGAISAVLARRGVAPVHVTPATLAVLLSPERLAEAARWSSLAEPINRDLRPTTYRLALDRILDEFGDLGEGALLVLAAALALGALLAFGPRSRPVELAVLTSGAAGLSVELISMLAYQIATGALYRELGLLLAAFMAGAAAGARLFARRGRFLLAGDALQGLLAAGLALLLPRLVGSPLAARVALPAAVAAAGFCAGGQFAAAARALAQPRSLYAADLLGAAVAALVTLLFLVPALGLPGALVAVAAIKVGSGAALLSARPRAAAGGSPLAPLVPLSLAGFVLAVAADPTEVPLYAAAFSVGYRAAACALLAGVLLAAFTPRRARAAFAALARRLEPLRRATGLAWARLATFVLLLPIAAFPVGRCYFQIPFLFCHVCPRRCPFGVFRPYAVPVALLGNLGDRRFCERVCPLGSAQAAVESVRPGRARRRPALAKVRLAVLVFAAVAYFLVERGHGPGLEGTGLYAVLARGAFLPSLWVITAMALLLLLALFVRRPFCDALCPIGAASSLLAPVEEGLVRLRLPRREPAPEGP